MKRKLLFFSLFFTRAIFSTEKNLLSFEKEAAYVKKAFEVVGSKADTEKLLFFYGFERPLSLKESCEISDDNYNHELGEGRDYQYCDDEASHVRENLKKFGLIERKNSVHQEENMCSWVSMIWGERNLWNSVELIARMRTEKIIALGAQIKVLMRPIPRNSKRICMLPKPIKYNIASYVIDDIIVFCSYKEFADAWGGHWNVVQHKKKGGFVCTIF